MSDSSLPTPVPQREKLNLSTKLAYGVGDFGSAVSSNVLIFFQLIFLTNVAGLSPVLAGSIRTIAGIWDAVNDPMVGVLSDRTRTRWGRRYPWMFWGAIPLGIFFVLQWVIPQFSTDPGRQEISLFWFYVIISIFYNMAFTAVNLPYTALTPELTQDYDERTTLNQYRFTFSLTGAVLSLVFAQIIFSTIENPIQQYLWIVFVRDWHLFVFLAGFAKYGVNYSLLRSQLDGIARPTFGPSRFGGAGQCCAGAVVLECHQPTGRQARNLLYGHGRLDFGANWADVFAARTSWLNVWTGDPSRLWRLSGVPDPVGYVAGCD
jgi:hypothetical protein